MLALLLLLARFLVVVMRVMSSSGGGGGHDCCRGLSIGNDLPMVFVEQTRAICLGRQRQIIILGLDAAFDLVPFRLFAERIEFGFQQLFEVRFQPFLLERNARHAHLVRTGWSTFRASSFNRSFSRSSAFSIS